MFHHVLTVPNLSNPQQQPWQEQHCTEWHIRFPREQLSNGTTCSFVEDSSMVNYSHQAPMKRLGKLPEKRGKKEAEVASLGRSWFHFKFPIRCQTAVAVTERLWWYSRGCWIRWWRCCCGGCFTGKLQFFWGRNMKVSWERLSMKNQKELQFRVSDRESDILDLHVAPAWTDSCFLEISVSNQLLSQPIEPIEPTELDSYSRAASEWRSARCSTFNRLFLALLPCFHFHNF